MLIFYIQIILLFLNNIYFPKHLNIYTNEIIPNNLKISDVLFLIKLWVCKKDILVFDVIIQNFWTQIYLPKVLNESFLFYFLISYLEIIFDGSFDTNDFSNFDTIVYFGKTYNFSNYNHKYINKAKFPLTKIINSFLISSIISCILQNGEFVNKHENTNDLYYLANMIYISYIVILRLIKLNIPKILKFICLYILDHTISKFITKHIYIGNLHLKFDYNQNDFIIKSEKFKHVFLRKYKSIDIDNDSEFVSPVDGLLIQSGKCENNLIFINKQSIDISKILNKNITINNDYKYSIYYLTYKDYHYVHSPIDCVITNVYTIKGTYHWMENSIEFGCKFLGKNYRCVFEMIDINGNKCFLIMIASIIAGTIIIDYDTVLKKKFMKGDIIAHFDLGSMVVFISNYDIQSEFSFNNRVKIGKKNVLS